MNLFIAILTKISRKLIRIFVAIPQYTVLREVRYRGMSHKMQALYYSSDARFPVSTKKTVVYMADGKLNHGGLADRLRGIVSLFQLCMKQGYDFKINFTSPFNLKDYLIPNEYDWRISTKELSFNSQSSKPIFLIPHKEKILGIRFESFYQRWLMNRFLKSTKTQFHVYTNAFYGEKDFGRLFNMLFKPTDALMKLIRQEELKIGAEYISISTRFLELLGDFDEPERMVLPLSKQEQINLIDACLNQIEIIRRLHAPLGKILVTSDSNKFLEVVKNLDYCHVIEGEVAHMDHDNTSELAHLKTFLDFYMIAKAKKSFLLVGPRMYSSNFSKRASQVYNNEFHQIVFD